MAPDEATLQPNAGASLTANIDALRAYEEGVGYSTRLLNEQAEAAFRRAIELDPQFAMAHYQLAKLFFYRDVPVQRQEIARAAELAARLPLPRQQKLLIEARGRLDKAAARYEEAARLSAKLDKRRSFVLEGKAMEIYLEQEQPEQALALARRMRSPWAPGFRGIANLILKNDAAAEREFSSLRTSLAPVVGDYAASKFITLDRVLAALYAGHWQQVVAEWPQVDGEGFLAPDCTLKQ